MFNDSLFGQVYQGLLERDTTLAVNVTGRPGEQLDIVVENMGRVNFGSKINDYKARLDLRPAYHCYCGCQVLCGSVAWGDVTIGLLGEALTPVIPGTDRPTL